MEGNRKGKVLRSRVVPWDEAGWDTRSDSMASKELKVHGRK